MPETVRTFIAIDVPEAQRDLLVELREGLAAEVRGARWVDRSQYHLTLAFLGDVEAADLDALGRAVGDAAAGCGPLELQLSGLGAFPGPRRPRVFWAALRGPGLEALERLHADVCGATARVGYRADVRGRFSPHVTLARFKAGPGRGGPPDLSDLLRRHGDWETGPFRAGEILTYASELRPEGPVYTPLARHALSSG